MPKPNFHTFRLTSAHREDDDNFHRVTCEAIVDKELVLPLLKVMQDTIQTFINDNCKPGVIVAETLVDKHNFEQVLSDNGLGKVN